MMRRWRFFLTRWGRLFLLVMGLTAAACIALPLMADMARHGDTSFQAGTAERTDATMHSWLCAGSGSAWNADSGTAEKDSGLASGCIDRPYKLNANFKVTADSLWLYRLPLADSLPVVRGDVLVVAETALIPDTPEGELWVKVARDQQSIGWLREKTLLQGIVPVGLLSQGIYWLERAHRLPVLVCSAGLALWLAVRTARRRQIGLERPDNTDCFFPLLLSWLLAVAATLYSSMLHFCPWAWEAFYFNPSPNPLQQPLMAGLFVSCVWLAILVGTAMVDDLFHRSPPKAALLHLTATAAGCVFLFVAFTSLPIGLAYACLAAYSAWTCKRMSDSWRNVYVCGACGAKMRNKGICPHCGALNE